MPAPSSVGVQQGLPSTNCLQGQQAVYACEDSGGPGWVVGASLVLAMLEC